MVVCSKCKGGVYSYGNGNNKYNKCSNCGEVSYPLKNNING
jgi:hypothetical protein